MSPPAPSHARAAIPSRHSKIVLLVLVLVTLFPLREYLLVYPVCNNRQYFSIGRVLPDKYGSCKSFTDAVLLTTGQNSEMMDPDDTCANLTYGGGGPGDQGAPTVLVMSDRQAQEIAVEPGAYANCADVAAQGACSSPIRMLCCATCNAMEAKVRAAGISAVRTSFVARDLGPARCADASDEAVRAAAVDDINLIGQWRLPRWTTEPACKLIKHVGACVRHPIPAHDSAVWNKYESAHH